MPGPLRLPDQTLILHRYGLAKELSLPQDGDEFTSDLLASYRIRNGVLHNPKSDRRTTQGTFHVAEGGLPVPGDKRSVPKQVFAALFHHAMNPPAESMVLPFTAKSSLSACGLASSSRDAKDAKPQAEHGVARAFVSLLLRPIVCPEVPGFIAQKSMEVRFFAPGTLVSNLDFVESIFSNAGDPFLPENDAALDVEHWTGHTGCVILAPHLVNLTKKELGLPSWNDATVRQKRDGMCWQNANEQYNDGSGFKLTCRPSLGVIVTLIADNYYGYCKKEVKTQISYAANLYGSVEEEHAGGAVAFNSYSFGDEFVSDPLRGQWPGFRRRERRLRQLDARQPEGYGIDRTFPSLIYIPEAARAERAAAAGLVDQRGRHGAFDSLTPGNIYMTPSGFKIRMEKHPGAQAGESSARAARASSATSHAPFLAAAKVKSASRWSIT